MLTLCGQECCDRCERKDDCGGCANTEGRPFGGICVAAESVRKGGSEELSRMKKRLIGEINSLGIEGLFVEDLNLLNGFFVNLEYTLPNGQRIKLLRDENIYWGNQVERPASDRCYGIAADAEYLLICEYGCNGADPQIVMYKKREL